MTRSFKDIIAWQVSHQFVLSVYSITRTFPEDEKFGLTSQFRRAAISIAANIAEGYKKLSKADKLRFLNIAQGSLEECRYYVLLAFDLQYIDKTCQLHLEELVEKASWFLNAYSKGIINNNGLADKQ